jgi:tetratricopeptide (TPR) repeat protein
MSRVLGAWLFLGAVAVVQAGFVVLNVLYPDWVFVDLDEEYNLPTYFQTALLATASILAACALFTEAAVLGRAGRPRFWALTSWAGVSALFAGMALDESLVIHERFNGEAARAWFRSTSPVQGTVVWLVILGPAVVCAMVWLLAWVLARGRISPTFARFGLTAIGLWLAALVFEGTAKSVFIPVGLYRLEVALEESGEALAPAIMCVAIWAYIVTARAHAANAQLDTLARIAVPWRRLGVATGMAIGVPAVIVAGSVLLNPAVRLRHVADEQLRAGRLAEAAATYRTVIDRRPRWARVWDHLGVAEYRRGNLTEAGEAFAMAAKLEPRDASMIQHVGVVLYQQGRHAEAAEAFRRSVALEPHDPDSLRNLAATLDRLGRDLEAQKLRARANRLAPESLRVVAMRVSLPAALTLVYLTAPGLEPALERTRAGQLDAALALYRAHLGRADARVRAAAHVGAGNELLRWYAAIGLTRDKEPIRVPDSDLAPTNVTALFADWIRQPDGRWEAMESVVAPPEAPPAGRALVQEAKRHYEQALALGAGAAARVGLAALAFEAGESEEVDRQLTAARALDPSLPASVLSRADSTRVAQP